LSFSDVLISFEVDISVSEDNDLIYDRQYTTGLETVGTQINN